MGSAKFFCLLVGMGASVLAQAAEPYLSEGLAALPGVAHGPSAPLPACEEAEVAPPPLDFSRGLPNEGMDASTPEVPANLCHLPPSDPAWRPLLQALAVPIAASLERKQPYNVDPEPPRTRFHTGFDYHSHVHALWAELYLARAAQDPTALKRAKAGVPLKDLVREAAVIEPQPSNVYGAAWFALLLREYAKSETDPSRIAQIEKSEAKVREKIFHFLAWQKRISLTNYQAFSDGLHEDPALILTLLSRGNLSEKEKAEFARYKALLDPIEHTPQTESFAFFSRRAYLGLIDGEKQPPLPGTVSSRVDAAGEEPYARSIARGRPLDLGDDIPYSPLVGVSHLVGRELTSAWPQAAQASTCEDWLSVARQILARPDYWKTSFLHSHYIPQFIAFGFALQRGDL